MRQFVGNFTNKVDTKGRVSIPAPFRALLRDAEGATHLILRPSGHNKCIDAWPVELFHSLAPAHSAVNPFDPEADRRYRALFGRAMEPQVDEQGRMILPPKLAQHAGIDGEVMFIGAGPRFEIWEPAAGERSLEEAEF